MSESMSNKLPIVYIDTVSLESSGENQTIVDILLKMKIESENDLFFNEIEKTDNIESAKKNVEDNLEIKILSTTDEAVFSILKMSKELVYYIMNDKILEMKIPLFLSRVMYTKGIIDINPLNVTSEQKNIDFKNHIASKIKSKVSINPIRDIGVSKTTEKKETLETGEKVLNIFFKAKDKYEKNPSHLSYFVMADYKDEIINDGGKKILNNEDITVNGELIINNSRVISHTFSYFLTSGELWRGEVFRDPEGIWRAGKASDYIDFLNGRIEEPQRLEERAYYNNKIQDFRNVSDPTFLSLNNREQYLTQEQTRFFERENKKKYIKERNIHPLVFSGKSGNGVTISVDSQKLFEKHSKFYSFLKEIGQPTDLTNFKYFRSVRAYRKRIQEPLSNSSIGVGQNSEPISQQVLDFSKNEKPVYIDKITNSFNFQTMDLQFAISDEELQNFTDGSYCYGFEIVFSDPYTQIFESKLLDLEKNIGSLIAYQNDSNIVGINDYEDGHYDPSLNKMTQKFKDKYAYNSELMNGVFQATNLFLDSLSFINNTNIDRDPTLVIYKMIKPAYATPDSVLQFLKLYENLIYKYKKIINEMKPFTLYEERKYFNNQQHIVTNNSIFGTNTKIGDSTTTSLENNFLQDIKEYSDLYNVTIEKKEKDSDILYQAEKVVALPDKEKNSIENFISQGLLYAQDIQSKRTKENIFKSGDLLSRDKIKINIKQKKILNRNIQSIYYVTKNMEKERNKKRISKIRLTEANRVNKFRDIILADEAVPKKEDNSSVKISNLKIVEIKKMISPQRKKTRKKIKKKKVKKRGR